jgi:5,10-methenyltetrahydromethanopterin hydrogenase
MDPKQTLIDLLESIAANDGDGATAALDAILEWRSKGGFMPEAMHKALDALRFE